MGLRDYAKNQEARLMKTKSGRDFMAEQNEIKKLPIHKRFWGVGGWLVGQIRNRAEYNRMRRKQ